MPGVAGRRVLRLVDGERRVNSCPSLGFLVKSIQLITAAATGYGLCGRGSILGNRMGLSPSQRPDRL
jgi:hypothetical protein